MTDTIIMIHGMWGGSWYWEEFATYFEKKGYRCIVPALRYHDISPDAEPHPLLGTTSLLDYAADLEQLIQELDAPPILMGHSMGGLLAQILAGRGLARAVVLLNPAAPYGILAIRPSVIRAFWSVFTKWGFWKKPNRLTFDEAVYSIMNLISDDQQKEYYSRFVFESGRAAMEIGFWFLDRKKTAMVDEAEVTCPVLVISGAKDRITPPSVVRKVSARYRAVSTYMELKDHAHLPFAESGWQDVGQRICDWLAQALATT